MMVNRNCGKSRGSRPDSEDSVGLSVPVVKRVSSPKHFIDIAKLPDAGYSRQDRIEKQECYVRGVKVVARFRFFIGLVRRLTSHTSTTQPICKLD